MLQAGFIDNPQRPGPSSPLAHRTAAANGTPTAFRAPAHKHAHHLHSIPPREKSTRTLIIDHLLWVHARTRFAQARAELGMTDRTGGPSAPNYAHRERPENYEEDEEVYSDGEDVYTLTARAGGPGHVHEDEDGERQDMQNLALARSLRQRAESVEKVIASMLDQPPEVPPLHPDDLLDPPTSPQLQPQNLRQNLHILPNGVRLRLAVATVINDLFARRAPTPPTRPYSYSSTSPLPQLPPVLIPLRAISIPDSTYSTRRPVPNQYIRSLYATGADPDAQNSPPSLRCPRHLHMSCEICVEAKVSSRPSGSSKTRSASVRAGSTTGSSPGDNATGVNGGGNVFGLGGCVTGWQEGSGIGSGLARPGPKGTVLRRRSDAYQQVPPTLNLVTSQESQVPAMANTKLAELVVRFMRLSALVAVELGREAVEERASADGNGRDDDPSTSPVARQPTLSPQVPMRPLAQRTPQMQPVADLGYATALRPSRDWYMLLAGLLTRTVLEGYMTGGWVGVEPLELLLGVGLGISPSTGRLSESGASGSNVDTSSSSSDTTKNVDVDADRFREFDPDDLPELEDAARILFPALREVHILSGGNASYPRREGAELEYEIEMSERLARFYDVPQSTPDVATHMEDLAWQFPAEVVERAACRFCEAVSRWRGKPELETYKKAPWISGGKDNANGAAGTSMSIDSLVHSNPTSPSNQPATVQSRVAAQSVYHADNRLRRPAIEKYFTLPPSFMLQGRKRRRSEADRGDEGRRVPTQLYA